MEYFATCNGIAVHISDSQKGEKCLILLHGYLETLNIWEDFIKLLLPKMRIISIDLPGHGLTGTNKEINTIEFSADVVRAVLEKCGVQKTYIMGHSMGGYIAIEAVKRYPQLFEGLVLMHSVPFADTPEKKSDRDREISLIKQAKLQTIARLGIPKMFSPNNLRRMDEKIFEIIELTETHDPEGIAASVEGLKARPDNFEFLKECKTPLIMFFGAEDYHIPAERAELLAKELPNAETVFLANSGHNGFLEEPVVVQSALERFMAL
jgi:pimeloyl-ACP methyl ester carboxylesterase